MGRHRRVPPLFFYLSFMMRRWVVGNEDRRYIAAATSLEKDRRKWIAFALDLSAVAATPLATSAEFTK